jgi:hypothetical protein
MPEIAGVVFGQANLELRARRRVSLLLARRRGGENDRLSNLRDGTASPPRYPRLR